MCSSRSAKVKVVGRRWGVAALDGIGLRNVEKLELELELESERRSSNLQSNPSVRAHTVSLSHSPPAKCAARRAEEARRRRQPIPARFFLACAPLIIRDSGADEPTMNQQCTRRCAPDFRLSGACCGCPCDRAVTLSVVADQHRVLLSFLASESCACACACALVGSVGYWLRVNRWIGDWDGIPARRMRLLSVLNLKGADARNSAVRPASNLRATALPGTSRRAANNQRSASRLVGCLSRR